ncbi:MAG TPA: hypothetical protein VJ835_06805 [Fimbriimonadaceae bacterium]|nr:hypothetical protein [Fimbriimonadaceae bacterium]
MMNPPPPVTKPIPWLPILVILGLGVFSIFGLCAFGGYQAMKMMGDMPQRKGSGQPTVVATLQDGWARYYFPEFPLAINLPARPEKDDLEFDPGSASTTQSWSYFTLNTDSTTLDLVGYWYRDPDSFDIEVEVEEVRNWIKAAWEATKVTNESAPATYGQSKGREVWGTFQDKDGEKLAYRAFVWGGKEGAFALIDSYYVDQEIAAKKEFTTILNSLRQEK